MSPNYNIEKFNLEQNFSEYQALAVRMFGKVSYQANMDYLRWLYEQKEFKRDNCCLLLLVNKKIVGCICIMYLDWSVGPERVKVAIPHNLVVLPEFRKGVLGMLLTYKIISENQWMFIPGVSGKWAMFHERVLKMTKIPLVCYRKILRPLRGGIKIICSRILNIQVSGARFSRSEDYLCDCCKKIQFTTRPSVEIMQKIADILNYSSIGMIAPYWDLNQVYWRFFHPLGPKHMLLHFGFGDEVNDFMILSLGLRHDLNVGRIIEVVASSIGQLKILLQHAALVLRAHGGDVLLNYCANSQLNLWHRELNWQALPSGVSSYIWSRNQLIDSRKVMVSSACGDYGFEAIAR